MTPPRLCDWVSRCPLSATSSILPSCMYHPSFPQLLGSQLLPSPSPSPSSLPTSKEDPELGYSPSSQHTLGWDGGEVGQGDVVKDWMRIEFLPSASWTERRSKDQCVPLLLLSLALPSQVPSCRNQSDHTCLSSYPGGGECIPRSVLPHPGPLPTPRTPFRVSPSLTACVLPWVPPPTLPEKTHLCQVNFSSW